jgi:CBS domain-containing protein
MNASDVMVYDVVTVGPEEAVSKAVQLLVDHDSVGPRKSTKLFSLSLKQWKACVRSPMK